MTTNNNNLVDLMVRKTGLERDEVEEQVRQFAELIQQGVQKNGSYRMDKLGTFRLRDGILEFEADENLALEVNHKYAGMKPIELIGAYKDLPESSAPLAELNGNKDAQPDAPVNDVEQFESEEVPVSSDDEAVEQEPDKSEVEANAETEAEAVAPEPDTEEVSEAETEEAEQEKVEVQAAETPKRPQESHDKSQEEAQSLAATNEKWKPDKKFKPKEDRKTPVGKWLIAAAIVIALGLSGWLVTDSVFSGAGTEEMSTTNNEEGVQAVQDMTESTDSESEGSAADVAGTGTGLADENLAAAEDDGKVENNPEQEEVNPASTVRDIAEASRQSAYGLRGGATPEITDGYTIVVHSLRNEAKVRRVNSELQQEGYRTIVFSANVMDTTFWRLGLGQFKTIEDALNAAQTLPDEYRENHFIKRIQ